MCDQILWFTAALRGNKNQISHFLDDIKGCGDNLDEIVRDNFFQIIRSLVKTLRSSKDKSEINLILNAIKWKYTARDHGYLRGLEIFKVLHEGNGESDNLLKKVWGMFYKNQIAGKESDKNLIKDVIDTFEMLYILTVGRTT